MRHFAAALLAVLGILNYPLSSQWDNSGRTVTETPTLRVTLTLGAVTAVVNKLTGESYFDSSAVGDGVGLLHVGDKSILGNQYAQVMSKSVKDTVIISLISTQGDTFSTFVHGDPQSGEVLVWQKGKLRATTGVYGARLGFTSFDLNAGQLILPLEGGIAIDFNSTLLERAWEYLTNWESQLVIFEGNRGSLGIWFEDSLFAAKRISMKRSRNKLRVYLETHNPGNFSQWSEITTPVMHLQAYAGDWRAPAEEYRQWMEVHFQPQRWQEKPAWIDSLGCMVIYRNLQNAEILDSLAQPLNPRQVLIYVPDWRQDGYDVNYPDYTPRPEIAPFIARAHQLGFQVMVHVNPFGIAPYHPLYQQFKAYQLKNPFSGALYGWRWGTNQPVRHAFINPASAELQNMFLQKIREMAALNMDAIHLDVDFAAWNSDNGILNGENPAQGNRTFHRRLAEEFPKLVWGGENLTEVTIYRNSFAQRWKTDVQNWHPHPISAFLYGQYTVPVGYLGFVNPDDDPQSYAEYMRCYERWGVLPTLDVITADDLLGSRTQETIRIAEVWARLGLKPDFVSAWDEDTLFRLQGRGGERAEYRKTSFGTAFVVEGDSLYNRVTGVNQIATTRAIRGWYGYDENEIIGLDPNEIYWLEDYPRDLSAWHLHALSPDVVIDEVSMCEKGGRFSLRSRSDVGVIDLIDQLPLAETAIRKGGVTGDLADGAVVVSAYVTLAGITKKGIATHPPYIGGGGDVLITYTLSLPASPRVELSFYAGMDEGAQESDGVNFFVEVNGQKIFETLVIEKRWQPFSVDLSRWRGQTISLTIGNNPGPPGSTTHWDWSRWGEVRISSAYDAAFVAQLYSLVPVEIMGGDVKKLNEHLHQIEGSLSAHVVFVAKEAELPLPYRLLDDLTTTIGTGHGGLFFPDNRPWGAGDIHVVSCGGAAKRAINAHPPGKGRTVIMYPLALPELTPLILSGSYGIADGSLSSGVTFSIRVNGDIRWNQTTDQKKWFAFEIDLSPYAGKVVLLELITSPGEDNYYDWAHWADLVIGQFAETVFDNTQVPKVFDLSQPFPNPFDSRVELIMKTPQTGSGVFAVYDVLGRKIYSEKVDVGKAGEIPLRWNGRNDEGSLVSHGIYFVRFQFGKQTWRRKVIFLQ